MKDISLKEMQAIELELLLLFDGVCRKHGLRYYLDGGTLLGAMCYEGFIPWDDDIDLKMPRPDYERFLTLQGEFPSYVRIAAPSRENPYLMTKLVDDRTVLIEHDGGLEKRSGVYIDIFPMDGHPEDEAQRAAHLRSLQRLNTRYHLALDGFRQLRQSASPVTRGKGWLYRLWLRPHRLQRQLTELAMRYDYESASRVGLLVEGDAERECFPKHWLEPAVQLEFEGHYFPAPCGYREHMEHFYGPHVTKPEHYHNLPYIPPNHRHEVYWKENEESK